MAAATPSVLRVSSLDPDDPRGAGPPAPATPAGPPAIPGPCRSTSGTPVPPPLPAGAPGPPGAPPPASPRAGRGVDWVPPGAIRPRAPPNKRATPRLDG